MLWLPRTRGDRELVVDSIFSVLEEVSSADGASTTFPARMDPTRL